MDRKEIETLLATVWRDEDGSLWRTVGVITDPAVVIERVSDDPLREAATYRLAGTETHVLHAPGFRERFTELRPVE